MFQNELLKNRIPLKTFGIRIKRENDSEVVFLTVLIVTKEADLLLSNKLYILC